MSADLRVPRLAAGCRLRVVSPEETMLLVPEGALRLKGAGREIVELVDGSRSVSKIVDDLVQRHRPEDTPQITQEVTAFLEKLHARSVILFRSDGAAGESNNHGR